MSFKSTKQFVNFLFEASKTNKSSIDEWNPEDDVWIPQKESEEERKRREEREEREKREEQQYYRDNPEVFLGGFDNIRRPVRESKKSNKFKSVNSFVNYLFEQAESEEKPKSEEDMSPKEMVAAAIDNTPPDYMERSLKQRSPGPDAAGSTFLQPETAESLKDADWKPLTQNAQAITPPAIAFQADIPGNLGAADINDYPDDLEAVIQPAHGGKGIHRGTGKLMAELAAVLPSGMPQVDFTTIILGPSKDDPSKMQVWTFHPGAPATQGIPVFLEDMKKEFGTEDDKILTTVGKAKELGFVTIKHINALPTKAKEPLQEGFLFKRSRRHREF